MFIDSGGASRFGWGAPGKAAWEQPPVVEGAGG